MNELIKPVDWNTIVSDERIKSSRIMVIEDESVCIKVVELYLKEMGLNDFVSTQDADTAMDLIRDLEPDVILLDVFLGQSNGLDILVELRKEPQFAMTPVIVMTGASETSIKQQALDVGATDFLNKPLDAKELAARVRNALAMSVYQEYLRNYAHHLEQEVLQRRLAEVQLQNAVEKAEAANDAKSEFLAKMSHEIRTPMTAILGFADLLLNDPALDKNQAQQRNALMTIQRNGEYLLQILNDILDLSRIEARQLRIDREACTVFRLISDVTTLMRVRADLKGISFDVEFEGEMPETIVTDPTRVRQVLLNLVGNAIKFTEAGGVRLVVRFRPNDRKPRMVFEITDTGPGIAPDQINHVFEPFRQAEPSMARRYGGTGLGLTISRSFARLLGGDIYVDSNLGVGSTFIATIATGPVDDVPLVSVDAWPSSKSEEQREDDQTESSDPITASILLAEDGPDNQRLIKFMLERAGAEIVVAKNGRVAVEKATQARAAGKPFDLVLMDIQMPEMDGYEATRQLRHEGFEMPIIALTAYAMSKDRERCLEAGCDDYLAKPIERDKLLALVDRYSNLPAAAPV